MLIRWRGRRRKDRSAAAPEALLPLALDRDQDGGVAIWSVSGEIDIATRGRLDAVRDAVADAAGPLVLDLGGVTFMDSTGLAALLAVHTAALTAGRPLAIVCPEGPARLLLAVTGVEGELPLHPTRDAALAALR
jgi:anti-anti-sigma factor